jgi:transposase
MTKSIEAFVGCDVGDRTTHLCVIDWRGAVLERVRLSTTRGRLAAWFSERPAHRVVLEVGAHSRWISALLEQLGHEVVVANPRRVKLISASRNKTDRKDAELLARLGRSDPTLLAPIKHRGEAVHADLATIRARDALVRERTRLVNHVRGIVKPFGVRIPCCWPEAFHKRAVQHIPVALRAAVEPILTALAAVGEAIAACDRRVEQRATEAYPEAKRLSEQICGVGTLTALAFVLTIEDPARFRSSRDVAPFLGLVPKRFQSGERDPELHITKAGDALLRRLLVNCAQYVLHLGPDTDLKRWGRQLAARGRANSKNRAIVAVARKLSVLLHRLWVSGETYVPLGYRPTAIPAA